MEAEALKGHLDGLLLAVLADGPAHGYAVIRGLEVKSDGAFSLTEGTVYPALHRLEKRGLLRSKWSSEAGRRRRVYALTGRGGRAVAESRGEWEAFSAAIDRVWSTACAT
jgi:DNA-binding PadR family transcriptional regulator